MVKTKELVLKKAQETWADSRWLSVFPTKLTKNLFQQLVVVTDGKTPCNDAESKVFFPFIKPLDF